MSTVANITAPGWRANAVGTSDVRTVRRNGREYLQFPIVPLTEMVLDYPERGTKEYLPAEHIRETGDLWDGTLLTYVHPEKRNSTQEGPAPRTATTREEALLPDFKALLYAEEQLRNHRGRVARSVRQLFPGMGEARSVWGLGLRTLFAFS